MAPYLPLMQSQTRPDGPYFPLRQSRTRPDGTHLPLSGRATEDSTVDSDAVRVLVAEDDEGLGQVLARGLREQGYVVDLVPDLSLIHI